MTGIAYKHAVAMQVKVKMMKKEATKFLKQDSQVLNQEVNFEQAPAPHVPQGLLLPLQHEQGVWSDPKHMLSETLEEHISVLHSLYYYDTLKF